MEYKSYSRWFAVLFQVHHVPAQRLDLLGPFHHVHPRFLPWRGHPLHGVHAHPGVRGSHALDRIDRHPPGRLQRRTTSLVPDLAPRRALHFVRVVARQPVVVRLRGYGGTVGHGGAFHRCVRRDPCPRIVARPRNRPRLLLFHRTTAHHPRSPLRARGISRRIFRRLDLARLGRRVRYDGLKRDGFLHHLGVVRPAILRIVAHLVVRTLNRRISVPRRRAVTLALRRLPRTVALRLVIAVVGDRRIVPTLRATLRPTVITVRPVGSRDLRIRVTGVVMILDVLRIMDLFGIVGVRRVGRFVLGKAILLALRPLFGQTFLFQPIFVEENRVRVDVKRLDGRGGRRAHHARRPRGRGCLFQQIDQVQIGDPLGAFLAGSRLRFTPFPPILAGLVHARFVARANPLRPPFIGPLFALGLIRNGDEPGRVRGGRRIRADPIRLERDFRRRRHSFLAPPRLPPRNGCPLLFLRVPRVVPGRRNGKFLLPGRRGFLPS